MIKLWVVWILGLITAVPYAGYYLFMEAPRDEYALLITFILFWLFGYWALLMPLLMAWRVRCLYKLVTQIKNKDDLIALFGKEEHRDTAIEFIVSENKVPRFIVEPLYDKLMKRFTKTTSVS